MPKKTPDSPLKTAAIAIGEMAGKAVAAAESVLPHRNAAAPPAQKSRKTGKLPPKHKTRLPRRQKKALGRQAQNKA
jgi:hypothetical protein